MKNGYLLFLALLHSLQISVQCNSRASKSEESCGRADDCFSAIQQNAGVARLGKVNNALSVDWNINKLGSLVKGLQKGESSGYHCSALRKILQKELLFKTQDAVNNLKTLDFNTILKSGAPLPELAQSARSTQDAWLHSMWKKYAKLFSSVSHDTMNAFKTIANRSDEANVTTEEYQHAAKKALKDSIHDISEELGLNISNDSAAAETVFTKAQHLLDRLSDDAENSFKNITARHEKDANANVTVEEYEQASASTLKDAIRDISDELNLNISNDSAKMIDDLSEKFSKEAAKANPSQGQAQLLREGVHLMSNSKNLPEEGDTESVDDIMSAFVEKVGVSDASGNGDTMQDFRRIMGKVDEMVDDGPESVQDFNFRSVMSNVGEMIDDGAEADSCSVFSGSWHQSEHRLKQGTKCDVYSVDSTQDGCSLSIISKDAWWGERASLKADGNKVMIQMPSCGNLVEGTLQDDGDTISWDDGCEWTRSNGSWISKYWKTIGLGACVLAVLGASFYLTR